MSIIVPRANGILTLTKMPLKEKLVDIPICVFPSAIKAIAQRLPNRSCRSFFTLSVPILWSQQLFLCSIIDRTPNNKRIERVLFERKAKVTVSVFCLTIPCLVQRYSHYHGSQYFIMFGSYNQSYLGRSKENFKVGRLPQTNVCFKLECLSRYDGNEHAETWTFTKCHSNLD